MKAVVLTVDFKLEKIIGVDWFTGQDCWKEAAAFQESMKDDWKKPRYNVICSRDKEACEAQAKSLFNYQPKQALAKAEGK